MLTYVKDRPGHDRRYALACEKWNENSAGNRRSRWKTAYGRRSIGTRQSRWLAGVRGGEYLSYYEKYYENRDSSLHALTHRSQNSRDDGC